MKRVLVTGATGFIGKHVVNALLKHDVKVIATSRNQSKYKDVYQNDRVVYLPFDFNNHSSELYNYFHEPDALIDLAWEGLPNYEKLDHFERNVPAHYSFIKQMVTDGCKTVTCAGTCLEYGLVSGEVAEADLTNPTTAYGVAKDTLRRYLQLLRSELPFNYNWLRLFYVYGDGQNPNSLYSLLKQAVQNRQTEFKMSKGQQVRDFIHVGEVAEYFVSTVMNDLDCGVINIASGKPQTVESFVREYFAEQQYQIDLNLGHYPYTSYEPMAFWASSTKLSKEIRKHL